MLKLYKYSIFIYTLYIIANISNSDLHSSLISELPIVQILNNKEVNCYSNVYRLKFCLSDGRYISSVSIKPDQNIYISYYQAWGDNILSNLSDANFYLLDSNKVNFYIDQNIHSMQVVSATVYNSQINIIHNNDIIIKQSVINNLNITNAENLSIESSEINLTGTFTNLEALEAAILELNNTIIYNFTINSSEDAEVNINHSNDIQNILLPKDSYKNISLNIGSNNIFHMNTLRLNSNNSIKFKIASNNFINQDFNLDITSNDIEFAITGRQKLDTVDIQALQKLDINLASASTIKTLNINGDKSASILNAKLNNSATVNNLIVKNFKLVNLDLQSNNIQSLTIKDTTLKPSKIFNISSVIINNIDTPESNKNYLDFEDINSLVVQNSYINNISILNVSDIELQNTTVDELKLINISNDQLTQILKDSNLTINNKIHIINAQNVDFTINSHHNSSLEMVFSNTSNDKNINLNIKDPNAYIVNDNYNVINLIFETTNIDISKIIIHKGKAQYINLLIGKGTYIDIPTRFLYTAHINNIYATSDASIKINHYNNISYELDNIYTNNDIQIDINNFNELTVNNVTIYQPISINIQSGQVWLEHLNIDYKSNTKVDLTVQTGATAYLNQYPEQLIDFQLYGNLILKDSDYYINIINTDAARSQVHAINSNLTINSTTNRTNINLYHSTFTVKNSSNYLNNVELQDSSELMVKQSSLYINNLSLQNNSTFIIDHSDAHLDTLTLQNNSNISFTNFKPDKELIVEKLDIAKQININAQLTPSSPSEVHLISAKEVSSGTINFNVSNQSRSKPISLLLLSIEGQNNNLNINFNHTFNLEVSDISQVNRVQYLIKPNHKTLASWVNSNAKQLAQLIEKTHNSNNYSATFLDMYNSLYYGEVNEISLKINSALPINSYLILQTQLQSMNLYNPTENSSILEQIYIDLNVTMGNFFNTAQYSSLKLESIALSVAQKLIYHNWAITPKISIIVPQLTGSDFSTESQKSYGGNFELNSLYSINYSYKWLLQIDVSRYKYTFNKAVNNIDNLYTTNAILSTGIFNNIKYGEYKFYNFITINMINFYVPKVVTKINEVKVHYYKHSMHPVYLNIGTTIAPNSQYLEYSIDLKLNINLLRPKDQYITQIDNTSSTINNVYKKLYRMQIGYNINIYNTKVKLYIHYSNINYLYGLQIQYIP